MRKYTLIYSVGQVVGYFWDEILHVQRVECEDINKDLEKFEHHEDVVFIINGHPEIEGKESTFINSSVIKL